jgi:hypothetical protein
MHRMPPRCLVVIFLEKLMAFSEFLHNTYTKAIILIKRFFGTPCMGPMNRRGSDVAAARHSMHPAITFLARNSYFQQM